MTMPSSTSQSVLLAPRGMLTSSYGPVDDLYEARSAVETRAAALAAECRRQSDLDRLGRHLDDMIRFADDPLGFTSADVRFHVAVTRAAQNPLLTALLQPLVRIIVEGMVDSAATDRQAVEDGIDHHRQILTAVEAGDAHRASTTMAQHLTRSRQQFPATVLRFT